MKFMITRPYDGECLEAWEPRGAENTPINLWPEKLTKKLNGVPGFDRAVLLEQDTEIEGRDVTELVVAIDLAPPLEDDGIYLRYGYNAAEAVSHILTTVDRTARVQIVQQPPQ